MEPLQKLRVVREITGKRRDPMFPFIMGTLRR
jgi:hypothetical protein